MNKKTKAHLIILAKNPIKGRVKTRIAKQIGEAKALDIYQQLLSINRKLIKNAKLPSTIYFSDSLANTSDWNDLQIDKILQCKGHLGDKMRTAINNTLSHSDKAILIGSDCPYITPQLLHDAASKLDTADVVIGPARDGGYYLIAMKCLYSDLFDQIHWSTEYVLAQTIRKCKEAGISYQLLPELEDIDTNNDWIRYSMSND